MAALSSEEKRRFLRALESDEEFRLAVAGLLGLREILEELHRLREDFARRFEAIERKLLEHDKRFSSHDRRFLSIERKLLEHDKRFEAIERKLLEHDKRFEAIERKLLEHDKRFSRIELELGALSESFYARSVWEELRDEIRSRGERVLERRRSARVDGLEIDLLLVTDKSVYVVEVKTKPKRRDVSSLIRKLEAAGRAYPGRETVAVLAGALIGDDVAELAEKKNVRVFRF